MRLEGFSVCCKIEKFGWDRLFRDGVDAIILGLFDSGSPTLTPGHFQGHEFIAQLVTPVHRMACHCDSFPSRTLWFPPLAVLWVAPRNVRMMANKQSDQP